MKNIFENAYFGKAYKTRDGRKAILVNWSDRMTKVFLYVKERDMEFYGEEMYELDGTTSKGSTPHDIVSEWTIDEEELDNLANKIYPDDDDDDTPLNGIDNYELREALKVGFRARECYRKAMEGII